MEPLTALVVRARTGDVEAYGRLVQATQVMAYAVALRVLRDRGMAEDAAQEAYLKAYRRLRDLDDPAAFAGWLRRIVITVALNMRRVQRLHLAAARRRPRGAGPGRGGDAAGPSCSGSGSRARC